MDTTWYREERTKFCEAFVDDVLSEAVPMSLVDKGHILDED